MNPLLLLLLLAHSGAFMQRPQSNLSNAPSAQGPQGRAQGHMGALGPIAAQRKTGIPKMRGTPPILGRSSHVSNVGNVGKPSPLLQAMAQSGSNLNRSSPGNMRVTV